MIQAFSSWGQIHIQYDGLVATKVDANGDEEVVHLRHQPESYGCAVLRQLERVEYTDKRVDYYWDTNPFDSSYSLNAVGRLMAMQYQPVSGTTVQEMYSYQPDGRLTKKRLRWKRGSTQQDLQASYISTGKGRPSKLTYPDGSAVTQSYNSLGSWRD